jgi:hypothetical protein
MFDTPRFSLYCSFSAEDIAKSFVESEKNKKTNEMGLHSLILSTEIAVYLETYPINLV